MDSPIRVEGLGKRFRRYSEDRPWTLQEAALRGFRGLKAEDYFWALKDVSFHVPAGRMTGLVGRNGAGKSTLLSLVGGVGHPTEGRIYTRGRIGALIDLGAGFHPDLTGRENIFINGVISGLTRDEVGKRFDSIVDFSELEGFIDSPYRTYSTGMRMRLAFSVAVHTEPEILLIDEVLAVGDMAFQRKCLERVDEFKQQGCAILLVSHDPNLVGELCDQALWLNEGHVVASGPAQAVAQQYAMAMQDETQRRTPASRPPVALANGGMLRVNENRFGSLEMEVEQVRLLNASSQPVERLQSGEALSVEMQYTLPAGVPVPIFGVSLSREDGEVYFDASTAASNTQPPDLPGKGQVTLHIQRLDLVGGEYFVDIGAYKPDWSYAYDYHWHAYPLSIEPHLNEKGVLKPPQSWEWRAPPQDEAWEFEPRQTRA